MILCCSISWCICLKSIPITGRPLGSFHSVLRNDALLQQLFDGLKKKDFSNIPTIAAPFVRVGNCCCCCCCCCCSYFYLLYIIINYNRLFGAHLCDVHFGYLQNPTGVLNMFYLLLHKSRKRWDASQPSTHNISQYFSKPYLASKKVQWNSWLYLSYTPAFVHTVWVLAVNFYLDSFLRLKQSQPILRRWILRYWFIYWIVNCT